MTDAGLFSYPVGLFWQYKVLFWEHKGLFCSRTGRTLNTHTHTHTHTEHTHTHTHTRTRAHTLTHMYVTYICLYIDIDGEREREMDRFSLKLPSSRATSIPPQTFFHNDQSPFHSKSSSLFMLLRSCSLDDEKTRICSALQHTVAQL